MYRPDFLSIYLFTRDYESLFKFIPKTQFLRKNKLWKIIVSLSKKTEGMLKKEDLPGLKKKEAKTVRNEWIIQMEMTRPPPFQKEESKFHL